MSCVKLIADGRRSLVTEWRPMNFRDYDQLRTRWKDEIRALLGRKFKYPSLTCESAYCYYCLFSHSFASYLKRGKTGEECMDEEKTKETTRKNIYAHNPRRRGKTEERDI